MNDTVYSVIQLNGSNDIQNPWGSGYLASLNLQSPLSVREPYYKRESNYMYMYVGVGAGKAVDLRVKEADNAETSDLSRSLHTNFNSSQSQVYIGTSSSAEAGIEDTFIWIYPTGQSAVQPGQRTLPSISIRHNSISGVESASNTRPVIRGFNIRMAGNTTIEPVTGPTNNSVKVKGCAVVDVPVFSLVKGKTYGTVSERNSLTNVAEGQVFFVIA